MFESKPVAFRHDLKTSELPVMASIHPDGSVEFNWPAIEAESQNDGGEHSLVCRLLLAAARGNNSVMPAQEMSQPIAPEPQLSPDEAKWLALRDAAQEALWPLARAYASANGVSIPDNAPDHQTITVMLDLGTLRKADRVIRESGY